MGLYNFMHYKAKGILVGLNPGRGGGGGLYPGELISRIRKVF